MRSAGAVPSQEPQKKPPAAGQQGGSRGGDRVSTTGPKKLQPVSGAPWGLLLFLLLAFGLSSCKGAPTASHSPQGEQDLHAWNEINDICSTYLTSDTPPQTSNALEDLCVMVLELLQKTQEIDEKDNTKRFLFHYSKTHETGNSDILSSVLHPLLQLVPQLHERRLKRYKKDKETCKVVPRLKSIMCSTGLLFKRNTIDELRIPGGIQSRGYFIFRPRNGRRSATFH